MSFDSPYQMSQKASSRRSQERSSGRWPRPPQQLVRDAGEIAKRDGRASIAASGFSRKWQNALRVNIYPPQGDTMRPAAFIYHKIRYAGVFEEGAVIGGQPLLWLPLSTVPLRRGRPMTPSQYARSIGPLVSIQRPGGPPLLFPKYRSPRGRRR